MMTSLRTRVPGGLILLLAMAGPAGADGLIRDGVGAVATGRGGTNIAHSDNGAVLLDNPAGIINVPGRGLFEIGIDTLVTDLRYSDADPNDVDGEFMLNPVPQLAYIRTSEDGRWAAGIGVFLPAGFAAEYKMNHSVFGPSDYRSEGMLCKILPGVAYRITDRLSVGATLGAAVSTVELEGPFVIQSPPLAGAPTLMNLSTFGMTPTWSVGLQYELTERTTLGVTYIAESNITYDGDVTVFVPGAGVARYDAEAELTWPQSVGIGLAHALNDQHRVSFDVIWFDWSSAFDKMDLKLSDGTNPALNFAAGGTTVRDRLPFDWKESVSFRFGYEFLATERDIVRAGYVYQDAPVPSSTLNPYTDGVLEHAFSVGYGRKFARDWTLNTAYQYSFGEGHVGQSSLVGGDFDNSTFKADAHWLMFSLIRRL